MMTGVKEYMPEQITEAEKMCQLINEVPVGRRNFVSAFMLAYMNGIETGIALERDAKQVTTA